MDVHEAVVAEYADDPIAEAAGGNLVVATGASDAEPAARAAGVAAVDGHEARKGLGVVVRVRDAVAEAAIDVTAGPAIGWRDHGRRLVHWRRRQIRRECGA